MLFRLLLLVVLLGRIAAAQAPDTLSRASGASVSGVVLDSIAGSPLAGATVQLVAADSVAGAVRTVVSDSQGRFTFEAVRDGWYLLGFLHPMVDSLGLAAPLTRVHVDRGRSARVDLAIPSGEWLHAAICGYASAGDTTSVVVGIVRDAEDRAPVAGVTVAAEWLDLSVGRSGFERRVRRLVATTADNGWFALCDVPRPGTIALVAVRGADSTGVVEVAVSSEAFARRDLYLGAARTVTFVDTAQATDSVSSPRRTVRAGTGRLDGTVTVATSGEPLPGAIVQLMDGPGTRADEQGRWTLTSVPLGTRTLEVRAVGYYPDRRAVNVIAGAAPVRVALSTLRAMLDTVRVEASAWTDRFQSGFEERRRTGAGRYLGPEDVARRAPINASDVFRTVAGVKTQGDGRADMAITLRGAFGECSPALFINGRHVPPMSPQRLSSADIDGWVRPAEIAGIEVYPDVAPPQFQQIMSGCGSIVIWTRPVEASGYRTSMKRRFLMVLGVAALGLWIGATVQ